MNTSQLVTQYTDQPAEMPAGLKSMLQARWNGEPVQLYALSDLDPEMRLSQSWFALGPSRVASISVSGDLRFEVERSRIAKVWEATGSSCTVLSAVDREGKALFRLRFSQRQRRAMANIAFVLQQQVEGFDVPVKDGDELYQSALAEPVRLAQASEARSKFSVVGRLLGYLKPYRRRLALGMTGAAMMTLMALTPPFLTGYLLDRVIRPYEQGTLPSPEASHRAWMILIAIASCYLAKEAFAWVRFRTMSVLGELVARDLRDETYAHLQRLSVSFFSAKQTGSLISRITSDSDRIWDFIAFGVVEVSISLLTLAGLGGVLLWLDWRLGLLMTVPVPAILYAIYRHGERMQRLFLRAWRKWSAVSDVLSDTIPGIRVVKAFNKEEREKQRFFGRNKAVVTEFNRIHSAWTSFWPLLMLSIHSIIILVWAFGMPRVFQGGLSVGTFVSFLFYMTMFAQPIEVIGQMARMLNRATSSAYRIFELIDTEAEIVDVENPVRLEPVEGRVTFENVTFGYDGIRQIVKGVSFDVKPGEMVGLVGPSGGGKTTLTNLIARFYEATGGRILIDGVDIRELDSGHLRSQVGMVLQDPYLFHGTILENIRYGRPEASVSEVIEAAQAANVHAFVSKLAHGYDTIVGERGHTLSGGERQRVSIARAVLHDPRILILDEATSSVDTETERKIQEALDRLVEGRTVFAIAHRLSTLTRASRLLVIEDGRIKEQGTHAELLAIEGGVYRKLHRLQQELHENYAV